MVICWEWNKRPEWTGIQITQGPEWTSWTVLHKMPFSTYSLSAVIVPASTMKFNNGSLVDRVCKLLTTFTCKNIKYSNTVQPVMPNNEAGTTIADWVDAQADLSLPWAHMSFCWFCHASAWATTKQAPCVLSSPLSAQWRLWSDWDEAQADLHLPWVHVILLVLSCFSMPNNEAGTTIANLKQKDLLHSNKVSMN